jgi:hypothetical protein
MISQVQGIIPAILATQKEEIRRLQFKASPDKKFTRPYFEKKITKKGLVE